MLLTALLPLLFFTAVILWLQQNDWVFELPVLQIIFLASVVSAILIGLALTPSTIIAVLCGYFLGWSGLIPIFISYPAAAVIGLYLGKVILFFAGIAPFQQLPAYRQYLDALSKHEFMMVAYMRLSPVMPFAMMNVFFASLPIRWSNYIWGSMAGMLPRTMLFFWAGMNAAEVWDFVQNPSLDGSWQIIPFVLIFLALGGLIYIFKSVLREVTHTS
jgi:uncharacterized membrane protein YdjX (TVP38/TMEM64 family)